jgi:hypothetical protein
MGGSGLVFVCPGIYVNEIIETRKTNSTKIQSTERDLRRKSAAYRSEALLR